MKGSPFGRTDEKIFYSFCPDPPIRILGRMFSFTIGNGRNGHIATSIFR